MPLPEKQHDNNKEYKRKPESGGQFAYLNFR